MSSQHYQISELVREWNTEYIERDIDYANNEIKRITAFIDAASARLDYLKHLSFKFSVECNRYKYSSSPVHFKVTLYKYPDIPNGKQSKMFSVTHNFTGRERKLALECAKKLAEEYKCEVEGNVIKDE